MAGARLLPLLLLVLGLVALAAVPATAQQFATLLADRVSVSGSDTLVAQGGVEVHFGQTSLTASEIRFDGATDRLTIVGPIVLRDAGGSSVILADAAELDADLRNGLIVSARFVLNQQLQLAAAELRRVDGRYTELFRSVASSCRVCAGSRSAPLWQIRAERIIHDEEARRLYFEGARFEVAGVPVMYVPRLRMPDPTAERATGFLVPTIRNSGRLGPTVEIPYFIMLGDHADITLRPILSRETATLGLQFRRAFRKGRIELNGAVTRDSLHPAGPRGYLFAEGRFDLPRDLDLAFDLEHSTDRDYLSDYGFSGKQRLDSALGVSRFAAGSALEADLTLLRTLRGAEAGFADEIPGLLASVAVERRPGQVAGGEVRLSFGGDVHYRASTADMVGRDVLRVGGEVGWHRTELLGAGFVGNFSASAALDWYLVSEDSGYERSIVRARPGLLAGLRRPTVRTLPGGAVETLEPAVALGWSSSFGGDIPNEDSRLSELDEGNLMALTRFAGEDGTEDGLRLATGLSWSRHSPGGADLSLTAGRVWTLLGDNDFTAASGLDGARSDWLLSGSIGAVGGVRLDSRALFDDSLDVTRTDSRLSLSGERFHLDAAHAFSVADLAENRPAALSRMEIGGGYQLSRHWAADGDVLFDLGDGQLKRAGVGLEYINECVRVDLSLSRRFGSSDNVPADTNLALDVALLGFGAGTKGTERVCHDLQGGNGGN